MVVGDTLHENNFGDTEDHFACTVLTTVVSIPTGDRVVIDAGQLTLGADSLMSLRWKPDYFYEGRPRYGIIKGRPDLWLGRLSVEVGVIYYKDQAKRLSIGDRLEIVPNNASLAIRTHNQVYGVRGGEIERVIPVTDQGRGN